MDGDLATIDSVKQWMNTNPATPMGPGDDPLLQRLVTSVSTIIKSYISRDVVMTNYIERYSGKGGRRMSLRNSPVYRIYSLSIGQFAPGLSADGVVQGYMFDPNGTVYMVGFNFDRGFQNVGVSYQAGYYQSDTVIIPGTPYQVSSASLSRPWASGLAVTYMTSGLALTQALSAPLAGQYSLSQAGVYTFNTADSGASVGITYGYIPADISQACIELTAIRYRERKRIGEKSVSIGGGQTVSFDTKALPDSVKMYLDSYRQVISP